MRTDLARRVAPIAAGAAVLAVLGASTYLLRDGQVGGPGHPVLPPLRIGAAAAAADVAAGKGRVTLTASLPKGPDGAWVYRFAAGPSRVAALAAALRVAPAGVHVGTESEAAKVAGKGPVLWVDNRRSGAWQFARDGADPCFGGLTRGGAGIAVSGCAVTSGPGGPTPAVPPTVAATLQAARPVLTALSLDGLSARVDPPAGAGGQFDTRTVRVSPTTAGRRTTGLETTVVVDRSGVLTASGWLGDPRRGQRYPVITARQAFRQVVAMPVPLMACPADGAVAQPGPACGGPLVVTAATLGLSIRWEEATPLLVPAWLFTVRGASEPITVIAVKPAYLAEPAPVGGGSSGAGGGAAANPGSGLPVPPDTGSGVGSGGGSTVPASRFSGVSAAGPGALSVSFTGGVDSCYTYTVVAEESAKLVSLHLAESSSKEVCIDLAQTYERTVRLAQPLGDRAVIDADSGVQLYPTEPANGLATG